MVLHEAPENMPVGQIAGNALPATASVFTLEHVWRKIPALVVVHDNVNHVRIVQVRFDVVDEKTIGHTGQLVDTPPILAVVFGNLDDAVVGANINQAFDQRRFG